MHTGNVAVMDADGYLSILGRSQDLVIRGGENSYPREIEEFLYTHLDVADVQVVGVPTGATERSCAPGSGFARARGSTPRGSAPGVSAKSPSTKCRGMCASATSSR